MFSSLALTKAFSGASAARINQRSATFSKPMNFRPTRAYTKYEERVHDYYERPRNVGKLDAADPNVGTGLVGAPACGDVMRLQIKVDDNGVVTDAVFKTFGCGSAIAR